MTGSSTQSHDLGELGQAELKLERLLGKRNKYVYFKSYSVGREVWSLPEILKSHFASSRQFSTFKPQDAPCSCHLWEHRCEAVRHGCVISEFFNWYKESLIALLWCLTIGSSCGFTQQLLGGNIFFLSGIFKSGRLLCGKGPGRNCCL